EDEQAPDRLVQERRLERVKLLVTLGDVRRIDFHRPRPCRRAAEQFLVEPVAPSTDRLCERDAWRDRVEQQHRVEMLAPSLPPETDRATTDGAPDRQATAPDRDRAGDPVGAPVVAGEQVVDARADNAADDDDGGDLTNGAGRET